MPISAPIGVTPIAPHVGRKILVGKLNSLSHLYGEFITLMMYNI